MIQPLFIFIEIIGSRLVSGFKLLKCKSLYFINKNWQQHLADDYSDKDDLFRVKLKPEIYAENQERLRCDIVSGAANAGKIVFSGEKIKIVIPLNQ